MFLLGGFCAAVALETYHDCWVHSWHSFLHSPAGTVNDYFLQVTRAVNSSE